MFTRQNQNWFNRLLLLSKSVEMEFYIKNPYLLKKTLPKEKNVLTICK